MTATNKIVTKVIVGITRRTLDRGWRDEEPKYRVTGYTRPYAKVFRKAGIKKNSWDQYIFPVEGAPPEIEAMPLDTRDSHSSEQVGKVAHFAKFNESISFEAAPLNGHYARVPRFMTRSTLFDCAVFIKLWDGDSLVIETDTNDPAIINSVAITITKTFVPCATRNPSAPYWTDNEPHNPDNKGFSMVRRSGLQHWNKEISRSVHHQIDEEFASILTAFLHKHGDQLNAGQIVNLQGKTQKLEEEIVKLKTKIKDAHKKIGVNNRAIKKLS